MSVQPIAEQLVKNFLQSAVVLIVDPSTSFGQTVVGLMTELGTPKEKLVYTKRYEDAVRYVEKIKPTILITEFLIDGKFGLELINMQSKIYEHSKKISILVTHNSIDSTIAEAAEEQVDDYILKPFSMGQMKGRIFDLIAKKENPSNYLQKIQEGKKFLMANEFEKASAEFSDAIQMDPKPALAHYYIGHTKYVQKKYPKATEDFRKGLQLQPLHYKCLLGEFDSYFEQKMYKEAYSLVPTIVAHFPISPRRLGNIFIAAVFSNNHKDIPKYFKDFKNLDNRPPELVKIFSAALLTVGKYYVKEKNIEKSFECFDMGVSVIGADEGYFDTVIRELIKIPAAEAASAFLAKFPAEQVGKKIYSQLSFLIDSYLLPQHQIIEKGKKLVSSGFADLDCYRKILILLAEEGRTTAAEDIFNKAVKDFPNSRIELNALLEGAEKKEPQSIG